MVVHLPLVDKDVKLAQLETMIGGVQEVCIVSQPLTLDEAAVMAIRTRRSTDRGDLR